MLTKAQSMPAHMASIHLRSMTRATPARMASASSRPHSLPSQMARCKHQSHSLIDIPRPEREALQIRRVTTPRASLTGLIAMAIDRYGVNGDQRPHAHPAAAPPARRGRTIGLTGSTPGISAPRMRPRVWCVLVVRSVRAATCAPVRPSGPPPPRMSGPPLSGHPRTPPAKYRPPLTRQPLLHPFSGVLVSAASHL